jgi:CheY-like chemotaxis protein
MSHKKRILVVDDEPSITRMIKLNLEYDGQYVVHEENSGVRAIQAVKDFHPDLILLDVMMPGVDGTEIASKLQGHPTLSKIPIIFLTAAVKKTEVNKGGGHIGGLPYLAKPVDIDEVIASLEKHLRAG